jgi:hypothetical protein
MTATLKLLFGILKKYLMNGQRQKKGYILCGDSISIPTQLYVAYSLKMNNYKNEDDEVI